MSTHNIFIKKDIRDSNGKIYIAKGKQIQLDSVLTNKLKRLGLWEQVLSNLDVDDTQKHYEHFQTEVDKMSEKYTSLNQENCMKAIDTVHKFIFEERIFKNYPHLITLAEHSNWYYTHSINVALLSVLLARELGYNDEIIREIGIGAVLHDIGLLFIDKDLLDKDKNDLLPEEVLLKQRHCTLGVMTLKSTSIPLNSLKIIEQHHERLDGTGYPNKLKKHTISDVAHIVAIADTLDTGTSSKTSTSGKSIEEVVMEMYNLPQKYNNDYIKALRNVFGI